jgi:predicted glutamine amidotransferase
VGFEQSSRRAHGIVCRLFGYVARQPVSVIDLLGQDEFRAFTALAAVHGDGWGMAWLDPEDQTLRSVTSATSAMRDPTYEQLAAQRLGCAGMVHLRWATPGFQVTSENTHPFVQDGYAFAHNGHIFPAERLEHLLKPAIHAELRGGTDSERYFRFVLQCIAERGDDEQGLRTALGVLTGEFPEASLNAFLLTPTHMFGVHINSRASTPIKGLRRLFASDEEIPHRHTDEYFAMDFRLTRDAVHVISSGLDPQGWTPVPENTAASVDLSTRELRRLDIPGLRRR